MNTMAMKVGRKRVKVERGVKTKSQRRNLRQLGWLSYSWTGDRKENEMTTAILDSLEDIAYLAANAVSVEDRRFLDLVLQATETTVGSEEEKKATVEAG